MNIVLVSNTFGRVQNMIEIVGFTCWLWVGLWFLLKVTQPAWDVLNQVVSYTRGGGWHPDSVEGHTRVWEFSKPMDFAVTSRNILLCFSASLTPWQRCEDWLFRFQKGVLMVHVHPFSYSVQSNQYWRRISPHCAWRCLAPANLKPMTTLVLRSLRNVRKWNLQCCTALLYIWVLLNIAIVG